MVMESSQTLKMQHTGWIKRRISEKQELSILSEKCMTKELGSEKVPKKPMNFIKNQLS